MFHGTFIDNKNRSKKYTHPQLQCGLRLQSIKMANCTKLNATVGRKCSKCSYKPSNVDFHINSRQTARFFCIPNDKLHITSCIQINSQRNGRIRLLFYFEPLNVNQLDNLFAKYGEREREKIFGIFAADKSRRVSIMTFMPLQFYQGSLGCCGLI